MRKVLLICALILGGLFLTLSVLDNNGQYVAERNLWKITKKYERIVRNPQETPTAEYDKIFKEFERFSLRFPNSNLKPLSKILSGRVYVTKGDYKKARIIFESIVKDYSKEPEIAVQAIAEIGQSYGDQKDWENVLRMYDRILQEYPLTDIGLQTPLMIAKFYESRGDLAGVDKSYRDAIIHYKKIVNSHSNTLHHYNALRLIASCYIATKEWFNAVTTLGDILDQFPDVLKSNVDQMDKIIKTINTISIVQLKDYNLPKKIYMKFLQENPDHPFKIIIEKMLNGLNLLNKERVIIEEKK